MAKSRFTIPEPAGSEDEQLTVLETFYRKGTEETALSIARVFGMKGDVSSEDGVHVVADGTRRLAIYEDTGTFWYSDAGKLDRDGDGEPDLPSRRQARKTAVEFLREHDWLPQNFEVDAIEINEREIVKGREDRERSSRKDYACVNFRPKYDGVESYGPGGKIKVYLGDKGEVIGLFRAAAETRRYARYPTIPREEIEKALARKLGRPLNKLKPTNIKLIYHSESSINASRFIQPAYLLEFESKVRSKKSRETVNVPFELKPFPATRFAPLAMIETEQRDVHLARGERLQLRCSIEGGTEPYDIRWQSDFDGDLASGPILDLTELSVAHRQGRVLPHVISVTVTDRNGMSDTDILRVTVDPHQDDKDLPPNQKDDAPDPYVGVEWCNNYTATGLSNISGTDDSAKGFKNAIAAISGWSSRFDWGNGAAWEQDFKTAGAPGGGTDAFWADNVHFAFFAGHGSSGRFWFGSTVDDSEMRAQDANWGDGILNWIVLHACQTMRANFEWDVWCDAFVGLHQMFGFHTNTQGSNPPLGTRFALWSKFRIWPMTDSLFTLREAWRIACQECYDSSREYSMIYAGQSGTDTANDHLPGFGFVSADPSSPYFWVYSRGTC